MFKSLNFLRTKVYRRTFYAYLAIVAVFIVSVFGLMYKNIRITSRDNFTAKAFDAFQETDDQARKVTGFIDRFLAQLYTNPEQLEDFYLFFGASVEDYLSGRLDQNISQDLSYLSACESLILDSGYSIRHMIYYSSENLVDMEYNRLGYSRQHFLTPKQAQALCNTGCVYQKDIHHNSSYLGKISFVLDLPQLSDSYFTQTQKQGCYLILPDARMQLGQVQLTEQQLDSMINAEYTIGQIDLPSEKSFYAVFSSEHLPYSLIYLSPVRQFLMPQLNQILILLLGMMMGITAITMVLIHRFSLDASYLASIMDSMERAEHSDFTPLALTKKNDEFDTIVQGLNRLYSHLDSLIQKEYKLTISQQKAQMDMLSAQLSPHFLYNTLERIRMRAVLEHAPDVAEGTAGLGLLYRNIVKTAPIISIGQELEITRQYLDLMTFLYGDQFIYHIDVEPEIESVRTPKIWMQPIVENFFKHNFQQDDKIKVIVIEGTQENGDIIFRFFDNIGRLDQQQLADLNRQLQDEGTDGSGIGLRNVVHRLRLHYGKRVLMTAENNDPAGICFSITLKKEEHNIVPTVNRG